MYTWALCLQASPSEEHSIHPCSSSNQGSLTLSHLLSAQTRITQQGKLKIQQCPCLTAHQAVPPTDKWTISQTPSGFISSSAPLNSHFHPLKFSPERIIFASCHLSNLLVNLDALSIWINLFLQHLSCSHHKFPPKIVNVSCVHTCFHFPFPPI